MPVQLTERELATVLAALRHWQRDLTHNQDDGPFSAEHFDILITPLTIEEIDELCERINFASVTE